jgi:hypothetical protein
MRQMLRNRVMETGQMVQQRMGIVREKAVSIMQNMRSSAERERDSLD